MKGLFKGASFHIVELIAQRGLKASFKGCVV